MDNNKKINKKIYAIIIAVVILILIDQALKIGIANINNEIVVIPGVIKIDSFNYEGGAFGVEQKGLLTFLITNFIVLGIVIRFMIMQKEQIDIKTNIALSMIIAGGISNVIDKICRGYVLKYICFPVNIKMNFADILIIVGWILLAAFFAIYTVKYKRENSKKVNK